MTPVKSYSNKVTHLVILGNMGKGEYKGKIQSLTEKLFDGLKFITHSEPIRESLSLFQTVNKIY